MKRSRIFNTISSKLNKALSKTNKFKETHLLNMKRQMDINLLCSCVWPLEKEENPLAVAKRHGMALAIT